MHINLGFWGAMIGISAAGSYMEDRYARGDNLATQLILAAGNGDDRLFYGTLAPYIPKLACSPNAVFVSAYDAATQTQAIKDGQMSIQQADHLQRFRDWCRGLV